MSAYFPRLTGANIVRHYIPGLGAGSHALFALHVLSPDLIPKQLVEYEGPVGYVLFINSHLGVGLYLFSRPHMRKVNTHTRIIYSVYGTVLFNFGSALFWASTKEILPQCRALRAVFGLFTSVFLLYVGKEYFDYVDTLFTDI